MNYVIMFMYLVHYSTNCLSHEEIYDRYVKEYEIIHGYELGTGQQWAIR